MSTTKPDFRKKIWGVRNGGKPPFLTHFQIFLGNQTIKVSGFWHDVSRLVGATFGASDIFGKNLNPGLIRCEKCEKLHFLSNRCRFFMIFLSFVVNEVKKFLKIFSNFFDTSLGD